MNRRGWFGRLSRPAAGAIVVFLAALIALGGLLPAQPIPDATGRSINVPLYSGIIDRVRHGQPYEVAAVTAQRTGGWPLRPFVTVRPPALAEFMALLPDLNTAEQVMKLLALAALAAWTARLRPVGRGVLWLAASPLLVSTGLAWVVPNQNLSVYHECWAGLLIALSLAARTDRRFVLAAGLGLLAALIRELAMPYLLVMAGLALAERRRGEALAFGAALALSLAALGLHAAAVLSLTTSHDLASPGWLKLGGWPFIMSMGRWNLLALLLGAWAAAATVPLALIGAAGQKNPLGLRLTALLVGYILGFMMIGQPHDYGWGFMIAPLIGIGLALSPLALGDLLRSLTRPAGVQ